MPDSSPTDDTTITDLPEPISDGTTDLGNALADLDRARKAAADLRETMDRFETPLTKQDTIDLLYGRRNGLNKGTIEAAFDVGDDIAATRTDSLLVTLMADMGDLNKTEARDVLDELDRLRGRYE